MSLFKHAMVSGINDALVDGGVVAWPDPSVGFEVASKIAADLDGPDMLPEGGLDPASALLIGNRLKEASDYIASQGYRPSAVGMLQTKQASSMDFADRAALVAEACMSKAAADASLTNVDKNTPESAARDDQHAALDQKNRATNKYLTGVGRTSFPSGGVVGAQQAWEGERIARNSLTALDKQAFAVTDEGHKYDAETNRALANALSKIQRADKTYTEKAPVRGTLQSAATKPENLIARELVKRHAAYTAKEHERGENAYNPFGGLLTQYHHDQEKKSFALTDEGHEQDAAHYRAIQEYLQSVQDARKDYSDAAPVRSLLSGDPMMQIGNELQKRHMNYSAAQHERGENALNPLGGLLTSVPKQANEDMGATDLNAASDMTPGPTPGALQRALMMLRGLQNKGYNPGPEAQVAAAGLGEAGAPGMEVMAHVLDTVKTASEADDIIAQILHHQGQAGELASPELVEAIQQLMAQQGNAPPTEAAPPGPPAGPGPEETAAAQAKQGSLLAYLKAAADGSLTDVEKNTPESAAQTDQHAALDLKNRAAQTYLAGVGNTALPNGKQVYEIEHAPKQENRVDTSNLPTNETKSAELAYVNSFRKIAAELGPHLPATMGREEKIAHLQTMLGLPPGERVGYVKALRSA